VCGLSHLQAVYTIRLSPQWEQEFSRFDEGEEKTARSFLQGYLTELTLLKYKPYTLRLFANRQRSTLASSFAERSKTESDAYGAALMLKYRILPTTIDYKHEESSQTGFFKTDRESNEFRLNMKYDKNLGETLLNASYTDSGQTTQGTLIHLKTQNAAIQNYSSLTKDKRMLLVTGLGYRSAKGDIAENTSYNFSENLQWKHLENLSTNYTLRYDRNTSEAFTTETKGIDFNLTHLLYETLLTSINAEASLDKFTGGKTNQYRTGVDFNYNREVPNGILNINMGYSYGITNQDFVSGSIQVINESVILTDGVITLLANKHVDANSIAVTDNTGTISYIRDIDYRITEMDPFVKISRIMGGRENPLLEKIEMTNQNSKIVFIFLILLIFAIFGCFRQAVEIRAPLPDIIWPRPPEIPRIRFVNSITKPEDLNIRQGAFKRFIRFLSGSREEDGVSSPYGLETDIEGRLFVIDGMKRCVHVFDKDKGGYYIFPKKETSFASPIDIAIDARGYIYVSDSKDAVVKIFKDNGKEYIGEIGRGSLQRPTGIAVNKKTNELLVVDTLSSVIIRYDLKDYKLKGTIGKRGKDNEMFNSPTNIFVSSDGYIVVSDSLNFRVKIFTPDGEFLNSFGMPGDSPGYFSRPKGVATDSDGNIYVVDALFDNVQIFDREGRLLMAFGGPGHKYGEFWLPSGIFIDKNDYIYISDTYNKRVQVFRYIKGGEF